MTKKLTILILSGLVIISANLIAEPGARGRDMMKHARFGIQMAENNLFQGQMLLRFKDEIGLTQKQVTQIEKMQDMFREAAIRKQADIEVQEMKLQSYLKKDKVDRGEMEKMVRQIAKMRTDLRVDQMNYLLDLKEVLTPDQLTKIESLKKEKRLHMMGRRNRQWGQGQGRQQPQTPPNR